MQSEPSIDPGSALPVQPQTGLVTLLFTDIVSSTALKQRLGDKAGATLIQQHNALVRQLLGTCPGAEEIETAGDSFLLSFLKPSDAVKFALVLQARLRPLDQGQGVPLRDRIGIHVGEVVIEQHAAGHKSKDLYGIQIDTCARVMSLAKGGQVLMSRGVFDSARQVLKGEDIGGVGPLEWLDHGAYLLKGLDEPVEICEVREAGKEALSPPTSSEKAQRKVSADEEPVLGWRPAIGQEVPNTKWVLEAKLGEGGFGEVWKARHEKLNEFRVFKFCFRADRVRSLKREVTLFRLLKERSGDHPNIVKLHDIYFDQPPFYLEEEYVAGKDLGRWCEAQGGVEKVPLETRLKIVAQVAEALQAAHDAGIIHRDVKPGNILLRSQQSEGGGRKSEVRDEKAEAPAHVVKLTDFGIGQVISQEYLAGVTRAGFTMTLSGSESSSHTGTQLYMAPELLAGKPASIRSDIYSMGVVLYQLLVGDFTRPVATDWANDITDPLLREDLQHCFAGNPDDRFVGAGQLADNLRSLSKRREERSALERAAYRRALIRSASVAVVIVAIMGGLVLAAVKQAQRAGASAAAEKHERQRAEAEVLRNAQNLYAADMRLAFWLLDESHFGQVRDLLAQHIPKKGERELRGWEWRYLWQESRGDQEFTFGTFSSQVYSVAFSADGTMLAAGDYDGAVKVWDSRSRKLLAEVQANTNDWPRARTALRFSPDGRSLAVGTTRMVSSNLFEIWDTTSWRPIPSPAIIHPVQRMVIASSLSPDGTKFATATEGNLILWDVRDGRHVLEQPTTFQRPTGACSGFSRDSRFFAFHNQGDGAIEVWDLGTRQRVASVKTKSAFCVPVALTPDARFLVVGYSQEDTIQVWALPEARSVATLTGHNGGTFGLSFSPDGANMASAGADRTIILWDCRIWKPLRVLKGHLDEVWSLAYSADGQWLASGAKDGKVRLWRMGSAASKVPFVPFPADLCPRNYRQAYLGRHGDRFMIARSNGTFVVYSKSSLQPVAEQRIPVTNLWTSEIAPDGRHFACWCSDGALRVFQTEPFGQTAVFRTHERHGGLLAFSPNGRLLVGCSGENMWAWDLEAQTEIMSDTAVPGGAIMAVRFSPDGRWVICSRGFGPAVVWNLASKRRIGVFPGQGDHTYDGAVDPSRRFVATVGSVDATSLWDPSNGTQIASLRGLPPYNHSVAFSPDGRRLATGGGPYVSIWDMNTKRAIGLLKSAHGAVNWLEFTDDDNCLLVATDQGVFSWRAPAFAEIDATENAQASAQSTAQPR